jgi:DNA-binding NtrC family response regulator
LLRLIEERRFLVIGGKKEETADVRFIIGTNADLERAVQEGKFLLDLYYRINVLPIRLPTLSERSDEIAEWTTYMLKRCAEEVSPGLLAEVDPDAPPALEAYHWPGNLRQLDNVVRRALMLALAESEQAPSPTRALVQRSHFEDALMMEHSRTPPADAPHLVLEQLRASAKSLVRCLAHGEGASLGGDTLDLTGAAFKSLVLLETMAQFPDVKRAFQALGRDKTFASRNHQRTLNTARQQLSRLRERLASTPPMKG